jgi:uncharacterized membrane protein
MNRLLEILLGLDRGFLNREGELTLQWNPRWPGQDFVPATVWNLLLAGIAILLVVYVYRREARSARARVILGVCRAALLLLTIAMLNRPVVSLVQSRTEPSVLAVMIDDSVSMRVRDVVATQGAEPQARLDAAISLLSSQDQELLRKLAQLHELRLYTFDRDAQPLTVVPNIPADAPVDDQKPLIDPAVAKTLAAIKPVGQNTQVLSSLKSVLTDLQGQRVAGVVVITDGRETPTSPAADAMTAVKAFGVKVYPLAVGSERAPNNVELQAVNVQDSVFKGDIVNVQVTLRGSGYEAGHAVQLVLKDKKTGLPIVSDGRAVEATAVIQDDRPIDAELQFKSDQQFKDAKDVGTIDLVVEAVKQPGEIDEDDNIRNVQVSVLDAKISVLYVDGYPRWEYRYIKNEMIRDKTVDISCLLTSADPSFVQEGDKRITRFPESIEELLQYDVVVFGDVDPRQFSDRQLQLVSDFVAKRGGGFGMVAGPRYSPKAYRNTAIEPILPVNITRLPPEDSATITAGFRLVTTKEGDASTIFRFFPDRERNKRFLTSEIQQLFWYQRGVTTKAGVGEVYAEHPSDIGSDGRKAPLLVLGRFGSGRTLFSGFDDSWRWRFYTGESVFDTYWVQQLRYLARSKKLGQRRVTLASDRPTYELGDQVRLQMRVVDPTLLQQLPDQIRVDVMVESDNGGSPSLARQETLMRQEGQVDLYLASFTADRVGKFAVKLPPIASGIDTIQVPFEVVTPRLELSQPQVNRAGLTALATETDGQLVELASAREKLPLLIPSAAKVFPVVSGQPLWDAPLAMALFVGLITVEWVVRKLQGMV